MIFYSVSLIYINLWVLDLSPSVDQIYLDLDQESKSALTCRFGSGLIHK